MSENNYHNSFFNGVGSNDVLPVVYPDLPIFILYIHKEMSGDGPEKLCFCDVILAT